jgi:iron(III) transport system substrate-binding protein
MSLQANQRPPRSKSIRHALLTLGVFALAALCLLPLACGGGDTLVLYSPHGRDLLALFEETYEAENRGVDVRWLDMGSQEVYDRVRSEKANPQADVWFGGPSTIFARGAEEGLLAAYRPEWAGAVDPGSIGPDDLYHPAYRTAPVILYNDRAVAGGEVPRDWDGLLDERFADEILIRDPLASGTMRTFFGLILARSVTRTGTAADGWRWLARLDAQTKEYVLNPALMIEKLNREEGDVTVWELTDALWQRKRGAPLDFVFPASGTPIIVDSIGLVAGAPHPARAKDFIDWVGSREAQLLAAREAFRIPARTDLPREELPAWAQRVIDEIVPADFDRELVEEHGADWMRTWDREIRGRGAAWLERSAAAVEAAEGEAADD